MQLALIRETKSHQLPVQPSSWWQRLHQALNDTTAIQALSKQATDRDGKQTLMALGVL